MPGTYAGASRTLQGRDHNETRRWWTSRQSSQDAPGTSAMQGSQKKEREQEDNATPRVTITHTQTTTTTASLPPPTETQKREARQERTEDGRTHRHVECAELAGDASGLGMEELIVPLEQQPQHRIGNLPRRTMNACDAGDAQGEGRRQHDERKRRDGNHRDRMHRRRRMQGNAIHTHHKDEGHRGAWGTNRYLPLVLVSKAHDHSPDSHCHPLPCRHHGWAHQARNAQRPQPPQLGDNEAGGTDRAATATTQAHTT